jgi:hypothetical protein
MFYDYTSGTSTDDWNFAMPFCAHMLGTRIRLASEAVLNNVYRHHHQETKLETPANFPDSSCLLEDTISYGSSIMC